jgi:hypothetical protein
MSSGQRNPGGFGLLGWFTILVLLVLAIGTRNRFAWLVLVVYLVLSRIALMRDRAARVRAAGRASVGDASQGRASAGSASARRGPGRASEGHASHGRTSTGRPPHEVLGVPADATPDAIRDAYRDLARQYHPDRVANLGPELREVAEARMREINAAFEALGGRR